VKLPHALKVAWSGRAGEMVEDQERRFAQSRSDPPET
jgi:hypothetical protein